MKEWNCECHGETYIHERLSLDFDNDDWAKAQSDAEWLIAKYKSATRFKSQYPPSMPKLRLGFVAEIVLARHLGAKRSDVRHPGPSDIEPAIEIRASRHPRWKIDEYVYTCIMLYPKDKKKIRERRWVLATVAEGDSLMHFWGWRAGASIRLHLPAKEQVGRYSTKLIGRIWPDSLSPMSSLEMA